MHPIQKKYGMWVHDFCRGIKWPSITPEEYKNFKVFPFYNISHSYDRSGWYSFPNTKTKTIEKGYAIITTPTIPHKYHGFKNNFYIEDAISFTGPVADGLFRSGIIKPGLINLGTTRKLIPIIEMVIENTSDSLIKANMAIQNLLVDAYFSEKEKDCPNTDTLCEDLTIEIRSNPAKWWTLNEMAEYCNLGPIQFNRVFKKKTGSTPKNYMDNFKMQMAVEMLSEHSLSIGDIAERLGYLDQYHFSRRFKQIKGLSPQIYRNSHMQIIPNGKSL